LTLLIVLGVHVVVVWLLMFSPQRLVKTTSVSLQLLWIPQPALSETAPKRETTTAKPSKALAHPNSDRTPEPPSSAPPSKEENDAIHPGPDWNEELQLAAKNALAIELAQKRREMDFAHAYPTTPAKPPQFAWNYAATHRIEAVPGGGMLIHIDDNCVLVLIPFPMVGCGIGKHPANGDLFKHMSEK